MTDRRLMHPEKRVDESAQIRAAMCESKDGLTYEQALQIIRRHRTKEKGRIAYKCPKCRAWHIGTPMLGSQKKRKRHV